MPPQPERRRADPLQLPDRSGRAAVRDVRQGRGRFDNPTGDPARLADTANRLSAAANAATSPSAADLSVARQGIQRRGSRDVDGQRSLDIVG